MPSDHLGRLKMSSGLAQSGSQSGSGRNTVQVVPDATYRLHGDFNRDGAADSNTWYTAARWEWGAGNPGAIIPFNNDDDGGRRSGTHPERRDFTDDRVNANDVELAPLEIRRHGGALPAAAEFKASLEVLNGNERNIRIHNGRSAGRSEMIGPARGSRAAFHDMSGITPAITLGMEALRYAGRGFNGLIDIRLTVYRYTYDARLSDDVNFANMLRNAAAHETTYVRVRVAPWIVPHHLDRAERVYVVTLPGGAGSPNRTFRQTLDPLVQAAGCTFDETHSGNDRWMQDCMEIGYSVMPAATRPHRWTSVLRCFRGRGLYDFPPQLAGRDVGWFEPNVPDFAAQPTINPTTDTTFDSGGNIECTPPVRASNGTTYPFGRVYYGPGGGSERFDAVTAEFFNAQVVQAPIRIDTNWLSVGHVDEMMSFIPRRTVPVIPSTITPNPYKRWKLVIANPRLAYQILDVAHGRNERLLVGRQLKMARRVWVHNWVDEPVFGFRQIQVTVDNWVNEPRIYYRASTNSWVGPTHYLSAAFGTGYHRSGDDSAPYRVYNSFLRQTEDNFQRVNRPIQRMEMRYVQTGTQRVDRGHYEVQDNWAYREQAVDDFLDGDTLVTTPDSVNPLSGADLRRLNEGIWDNRIRAVLTQLRDDIGLADTDIIEVPVLFYPTNAAHTEFGALTGDMVNMLVINGHCIPPRAYGPKTNSDRECRFERSFRNVLQGENLTVRYIDDWYEYHAMHGEVHCGTNTLRLPHPINTWLESAAARWWEFTP